MTCFFAMYEPCSFTHAFHILTVLVYKGPSAFSLYDKHLMGEKHLRMRLPTLFSIVFIEKKTNNE